MSERYDAIVVGAGVNGLIAVALLAKAGLRAMLLERSSLLFGHAGEATLSALDPRVVKQLRLAQHGLAFAVRDLSLTVLDAGGQSAVIGRDRHATARSLAALSAADATAYEPWRRALFDLGRALRPCWWNGHTPDEIRRALTLPQRVLLDRLSVASAAAWLSSVFDSDALKAALAFEVAACGVAPSEAGSALALAWCAAQEMCGRQGAVAMPRGGAIGLQQALSEAAQKAGAEIRTAAMVSSLLVAGGAIGGVELVAGESIAAPLVLSTLSRRRTLSGLLPTAAIGIGAAREVARPQAEFGCATLVYGLQRPPDFGAFRAAANTRYVLAERLETFEVALSAQRLGWVPQEPAIELALSPAGAERSVLTARVWPVGRNADRDALTKRVTGMIERHALGFSALIASCDVLLPSGGSVSASRLACASTERIDTAVRGLLLCGPDAEPAHAVSGVAARQAAAFAIALHKKVAGS